MNEEYRDITWGVDFTICVNGEDFLFSELSEEEQNKILEDIKEGYNSGTFSN